MKDTKYEMRAALGGGFGGCENAEWEDCFSDTEEDASNEAFEEACNVYEMYDGLHGLRSVDMIMEEDDLSMEDAEFAWMEERESWLDYEVRVKELVTL